MTATMKKKMALRRCRTFAVKKKKSSSASFITPRLPLFLTIVILSMVTTITCCQHGWYPFNQQKCLKYIAVNVNYADGESLCKANNASLASIHSSDEQDFILSMGRRHYTQSGVHWVWLGAVRNASDSDDFYWKDGTAFNFTNWRDGCPDRRAGENCVLMTIFKDRPSHWCNFKCDSNHDHVICQKPWTNDTSINVLRSYEVTTSSSATVFVPGFRRPPPVYPSSSSSDSNHGSNPVYNGPGRNSGRQDFWGGWMGSRLGGGNLGTVGGGSSSPSLPSEAEECDIGWEFKSNKCYKFIHQNVTGEEARYYCSRYQGQPLTIHSEEEQTWAVDYAFYRNEAKEAVWLGASRNVSNGSNIITWRDGRPMDYTNWSPHEPDNRNKSENCVAMNDMRKFFGRWIDAPCSLHFHLICEKAAKRPLTSINIPFVFSSDGSFHPKLDSNSVSDIDPFWSDNLLSPDDHSPLSSVSASNYSSSRSTIVLLVLMIVSLVLVIAGLSITVYMQRKYIQERRCMRESRMNIYYSSSTGGHSEAEYNEAGYEDPSKF